MKRILALLFLAGLLTADLLASQAPPASSASPDVLVARGREFIERLARGEFEAAAQPFNDQMKAAASPAKLGEIWTAVKDQLGTFRRVVESRAEDPAGIYRPVLVTTEFENNTADFRVTFDAEGRLGGFAMAAIRPAGTPGSEAPLPGYVKKEVFQEREVTVGGSSEWAVPGTLSVPVGPGPFPAVVLIHGSGPHDRDETVGPNKPFRDLAWGLASRGVAVLRFEKRTHHHAGQLAAAMPRLTVKEEVVDDALAAAALLRGTAGIDPKRVFVLGHSLGGMLIPRIGQGDPALAGLIVMAGATRPIEDAIVEQVTYMASLDGTVSEEEKQRIEQMKGEAARVKAVKPGSHEFIFGGPAAYWLDLRGYEPAQEAKALKQPLLVLHGERDYQVTGVDFERWRQALAGRGDVVFKSYPKLNHLFIAGEGPASPDDYAKPGHVAPEVVEDIAAWVVNPRSTKAGG